MHPRQFSFSNNACRFGLTAILDGHEPTMFLIGIGVEIEDIHSDKFDAPSVLKDYLENGGKILVCGSCLDVRGMKTVCDKKNMMNDLVALVAESDRVITFG
ncbi:MAG: DsrE family protein [Candidatus Hydrothermarchaeota archaeon]|nr:DsrE family protein [Candidatus Hydrothermarchaeota archaeon]